MCVNLLKRKKWNITFTLVFRPFTQYLVEGPLAAITASSLFWVWRYKLCTPGLGDFLPFFFANPLKLGQVGRGPLVDSHFQFSPEMFDRVQVRALAGLWLGHSRTFTELSLSHSCVILAVCFIVCGHCHVGRWTLGPVWGPERCGTGFHWGYICTLLHSAFPQPWPVSQSLLLKNTPTAWGCYQHTLLLGWYSAGDLHVLQTWCLELRFIRPDNLVSQSLRVL